MVEAGEHVLGDAVGEGVAAARALVVQPPGIADAGDDVARDEPFAQPVAEARQVGDRADRLGDEHEAVRAGAGRARASARARWATTTGPDSSLFAIDGWQQ